MLQFVYSDISVLRLLKVGCRKDNVSLSWSGLKTWMPFDLSSSKMNRLWWGGRLIEWRFFLIRMIGIADGTESSSFKSNRLRCGGLLIILRFLCIHNGVTAVGWMDIEVEFVNSILHCLFKAKLCVCDFLLRSKSSAFEPVIKFGFCWWVLPKLLPIIMFEISINKDATSPNNIKFKSNQNLVRNIQNRIYEIKNFFKV